eukprot:5505091-Prymnesium_polylepis.1
MPAAAAEPPLPAALSTPYNGSGDGEEYAYQKLASLPLGQGVGAVFHSAGLGIQSFPDMCFRS